MIVWEFPGYVHLLYMNLTLQYQSFISVQINVNVFLLIYNFMLKLLTRLVNLLYCTVNYE